MEQRQTGFGLIREYKKFSPARLSSLPDALRHVLFEPLRIFLRRFSQPLNSTRHSYDSCDVGTFRNQTLKDRSGPAAALHSDSSRDKYNKELSWLTGQKLSSVLLNYCDPLVYNCYTSSCSCPNSDHPGPFDSSAQAYRGRGAPEIDILEAEKDKDPTAYTAVPANEVWGGHVVSQSAQFAPFTHDYLFGNVSTACFSESSQSEPDFYRRQKVNGRSGIRQNLARIHIVARQFSWQYLV